MRLGAGRGLDTFHRDPSTLSKRGKIYSYLFRLREDIWGGDMSTFLND